jgi:hypothetical protein
MDTSEYPTNTGFHAACRMPFILIVQSVTTAPLTKCISKLTVCAYLSLLFYRQRLQPSQFASAFATLSTTRVRTTMLCFGIIALLAIGRVLGENAYDIRPSSGVRRRAAPPQFTNANEFLLSHSDEGATRFLSPFYLILLTTAGDISDNSVFLVKMAMHKFLEVELNAYYYDSISDRSVESVGSEVVDNRQFQHTVSRTRSRMLETETGSEIETGSRLEMILEVTFDYEPSPTTQEVEDTVLLIMEDLTDFVANLTTITFKNEELQDVTVAFRREIDTDPPTASPVDDIPVNPVIAPSTKAENNGLTRSAISFVAPVMAGATLIALGAYFVFRRKRKNSVSSPKGDMLYIDVQHDNYSIDRSLESGEQSRFKASPFNADSVYTSNYSNPGDASVQVSPSEADSVFSGVDSTIDTLSPPNANNIRSTKSLMSGYTQTSAATVRASNINEQPNKLLSSPKTYAGGASLFAFSEEQEGAFNDSSHDSEHQEHQMSPPSMTNSDVSEESLLGPSTVGAAVRDPGWCGYNADVEPILADLADLDHLEFGPRDPTPSMSKITKPDPTPRSTPADNSSVSYSVFNCAPLPFGRVQPQLEEEKPQLEEEEKPEESTSILTEGTIQTKLSVTSDSTSKSPGSQHSAKVSRKPAANSILAVSPREFNQTPSRRASASSSPMSVNSTTETPMRRNFASSSAAPGSQKSVNSQKSAKSTGSQKSAKSTGSGQVRLSWDSADGPSVTTMGQMSAQATKIIGSVYGSGGSGGAGSRSLASRSTKSGRSRPPSKPTTPSGEKSRPTTPTRAPRTSSMKGPSTGDDDYADNLSRPSTPGDRSSSKPTIPNGEKSKPTTPTRAPRTSSMNGASAGDGDYAENLSRPSTPGDRSPNSAVDNYESEYACIPFSNIFMPNKAPQLSGSAEDDEEGAFPSPDGKSRRHGGDKLGDDGTAMYQTNAMHPLDWSYKSTDMSVGESTMSDSDGGGIPRRFIFSRGKKGDEEAAAASAGTSYVSNAQSTLSARTGHTTKDTAGSKGSASRELINDLVWLEKKIADVKQQSGVPRLAARDNPPGIETVDSLSYVSGDVAVSPTSDESAEEDPTIFSGRNDSVMSSIVCRDCYAPPGRLNIVIHSTKDGPAVHTVKEGSSLEGHIFPGDLIISVDDVDTRSFTAEQVMKMMAAKSDSERKITVLHFEEEV